MKIEMYGIRENCDNDWIAFYNNLKQAITIRDIFYPDYRVDNAFIKLNK